jgi:hypothetical protein
MRPNHSLGPLNSNVRAHDGSNELRENRDFASNCMRAFLRAAQAAPASIELRLIDGDKGKSIDGAIVMGYWSRNPLPSLGCIPGALLGLPVHRSGILIVLAAGEARSDENGRVNLPDPEQRGWKPTSAHWLRVVIFKDGYWTAAIGRNDWSIAAVDPIMLHARSATRRFSAWQTEDVLTVVRQLSGQPKYVLKRKVTGQSTGSSADVRAP